MISKILSIAGRPGLYRLVSPGKNMLIVESLSDGKRFPAYARDRVMSLGDISIYTNDGGDTRLGDVLEMVKAEADGKPVDIKAIGNEAALRDYFAKVMPDYDPDRVYGSDIRKLLQWYNALIAAGITDFASNDDDEAEAADEASEPAEKK